MPRRVPARERLAGRQACARTALHTSPPCPPAAPPPRRPPTADLAHFVLQLLVGGGGLHTHIVAFPQEARLVAIAVLHVL